MEWNGIASSEERNEIKSKPKMKGKKRRGEERRGEERRGEERRGRKIGGENTNKNQ